MGGACNAASRTGQGRSYRIQKLFSAVIPTTATFLPHDGGAAHSQNLPCRPNATGTLPTNNETGMTTTTSDRASARCGAKEPTPKRADQGAAKTTMHHQNHCSSHDMTINRPHASQPTPNYPGMHGSQHQHTLRLATLRCATPAGCGTHEHNRTPQVCHYEPDQPTLTKYATLHLDKPRHS